MWHSETFGASGALCYTCNKSGMTLAGDPR
jgi:hypothetical protein